MCIRDSFLIDLALHAVLRHDRGLDRDGRSGGGGEGDRVAADLGLDVVFDVLDGDGLLGLHIPRLSRGEGDDLGAVSYTHLMVHRVARQDRLSVSEGARGRICYDGVPHRVV